MLTRSAFVAHHHTPPASVALFRFNSIGWALYVCHALALGALRTEMRNKYGIYGNIIEDLAASLFWAPGVISQMGMMADEEVDKPAVNTTDVDVIVDGSGTEMTKNSRMEA